MRPVNKDEVETLTPLIEKRDDAQATLEDAELALGREIARVRRACSAPSDALLDPYSFEWVKNERNPQTGEVRRLPIKA